MTWRQAKLGEVCSLTKGVTGITKAVPGPYPLVALSEERKSHSDYQFDASAVIIPLVSSTGHGHASLKRIHFQEGKFALGSILCALIPKNKEEVRAEYLYHYLDLMKEVLFVPLMKGMANVSLPMNRIASVEIPLPSIDEQEEAISFLRKHRNICESMQKESEYRRTFLTQYRQLVLQEAIEGKLTADWREANPDVEPASELLTRIATEKAKLIKAKKIRKPKPLPAIADDEYLCGVPDTWVLCRLDEVTTLITDGKHGDCRNRESSGYFFLSAKDVREGTLHYTDARQIERAEFEEVHKRTDLEPFDICMVNTGATVGKLALAPNVPETRRTTFQKSVAVIKPVRPVLGAEYIALFLRAITGRMLKQSGGSAINNLLLGDIRAQIIPLPPLDEQREIVRRIEAKFALCDQLEAEIAAAERHAEHLITAILQEVFDHKGTEL